MSQYNNGGNGYGGNNYGGDYQPQSPPYNNGPAMGRDSFGGQNVEMESLAQNGSQFGQQSDPNAILNQCRDIGRGIDEIDQALKQLQMLQSKYLNDANTSPDTAASRQLDKLSADTMTLYRELTHKVKNVKSKPDASLARNAGQVGVVDRRLKKAINDYQNVDKQFRHKLQEQLARQYRIVNDVSEEESMAAVADLENQQIFAQSLMQGNRSGQAKSTLNAVQDRSAAIRKIEQQMIELAELFQDMDNLVVQQEAAVVNIEQKGEEVVENMDKGVEQIDTAIVSARSRNRKKWWCLGICVLIVIIIIIIVLIYKFVIQNNSSSNNKSAKRSILPDTPSAAVVPGADFIPTSDDSVVPGLAWKGEKLVIPDVPWKGERAVIPGALFHEDKPIQPIVRKWRKFVA
ncbi:snare domain-containing protein [Rutstroemia sp. NJR-2017a BVV2]|nr:snare domain-containing protein [Rutstroemia sp. NJR-2017a BVV2]